MEIIVGDYKISTYSSGTCWAVSQKREEPSKTGAIWKDPIYFPNDLCYAFKLVRELTLKNDNDEIDDLNKLIEKIETLDKEIEQKIEELKPLKSSKLWVNEKSKKN